MKANMDIRRAAMANGVRHWQICKALGISEPTLTRWLREPLPKEKAERILQVIKELGEGDENEQ